MEHTQHIPRADFKALAVSEAFALGQIEKLSPQLRRAARFVLDNPGEVATRSLRHIAQTANIPAATYSRLASAVG